VVRVEGPEDVVAELVGVPGGKALTVDVHKRLRGQTTIGAVTHEAAIPFLQKKQTVGIYRNIKLNK